MTPGEASSPLLAPPQATPQQAPQATPQQAPQATPQQAPEATPQQAPEATPQQATTPPATPSEAAHPGARPPEAFPPAAVGGVSIVVPSDWRVLVPPGPAQAGGAGEDIPEEVTAVLQEIRTRAAAENVVFCAFGALTSAAPGTGAAVVLAIRDEVAPGRLRAMATQMSAGDPGCDPHQEVCRLPLAGPVARLSWTPAVGPARRRVACAEYYLPFPDDDRVAVAACAAVGASPSPHIFDCLDTLAGTLCFVNDGPHSPGIDRF
ncbi:MAG TPA: hypothetical protein VFN68_15225 [Acidimicrobiales bacterium]|nr:hypothetical protein [Acidimicrobiales bacterium]